MRTLNLSKVTPASRLYLLLAACLCFGRAQSQNTQLWLDYQLDYPFANQYLFEMTTSYQTLLTSDDRWRNYSFNPTFEYLFFTNLDLIVEVPFAFTKQAEGYNSFETTLSLGARLHITQNKRVNTPLVYKSERRFFQNLETHEWQKSSRGRLKAEATISINHPNLYYDKLWYTILDYEEFFVVDKQLDERYANRRRARLGLGYRLSYKHRFEMIYTIQSSRNEVEGDFTSTDNVLQLKYKMFLNPAKPATQTDTPD